MKNKISTPKRLALLIGGGSCVPWVLEARDAERLQIVLGLSHKTDSRGLELLRAAGSQTMLLPRLRFEKLGLGGANDYFRMVRDIVIMSKPDLGLCLGWDLILPTEVVSFWHTLGIPTVNLHPALVSADGAPVPTEYGPIPVIKGEVEQVIAEVLTRKLPATGCSLHLIPPTAEVDQGQVIEQRIVPVLPADTAETLRERERAAERELVQSFARRWQSTGQLLL